MEAKVSSHLNRSVIKGIKGFKLCSFLIAYEGWRRGLTLKWYHDETPYCDMTSVNVSTNGKFFSLENGDRKHFFYRSRGDLVSNDVVDLVKDKNKTKQILHKNNIPVPNGTVFRVSDEKHIFKCAQDIGYPVVVKPVDGSMGQGVFINIKDKKGLKRILKHYKDNLKHKRIILEKHYHGKEYRFYVVGNKVASIIERVPANVIGDGVHTIKELIELKNSTRKENPYLAKKPLKIDFEVEELLKEQNVTLQTIPKESERIFLRQLSNLSAGGDPIDRTQTVSSEVKQIAVNTLKALPNIPHAGVDIIINPQDSTKAVVLEVNATAEISFHSFPLNNSVHDVPKSIIDYYFPETINNEKSNFYFDYKSILKPLRTLAADTIEIKEAPIGDLKGVCIVIKGNLGDRNRSHMSWIRRQALRQGINGSIKNQDGHLIIYVYSVEEERIKRFEKIIDRRIKKMKNAFKEVKVLNNLDEKYIQLGFRIYRK